jgi:hypothetical protein
MRGSSLSLTLTLGVAALLAVSLVAPGADAARSRAGGTAAKRRPARPRTVFAADWASAPSAKYGAMTKDACLTELRAREIGFREEDDQPGVMAPIRFTGPVRGVTFRTEIDAAERKSTPYEIFDCRLALAATDLAAIVAERGFDEVVLFSAYRPPSKGWPKGKLATRHPGGLALDVKSVRKSSTPGEERVVDRDWTPKRDAPPCEVPERATDAERDLRAIYCAAKDRRIFTSMLSPNYDADHKNHFHLEITPRVKWRIAL